MSIAVLENRAMNIGRALQEATARAEQIKNDAAQRFPEAASIGDAVRQGDIYIQLVEPADKAPIFYRPFNEPQAVFPMQLADGNTKGSRHCLAHGNGVTVYKPVVMNSREMYKDLAAQYGIDQDTKDIASAVRGARWAAERAARQNKQEFTLVTDDAVNEMLGFAGPIVVLEQENTITHPEHGDWVLPPGTYRITYQRTLTRENTVTRVLD